MTGGAKGNSGGSSRAGEESRFFSLDLHRFDQAAGFVAALSRFLNYPEGERYRDSSIDVWSDGDGRLWLSQSAAAAATAAFGTRIEDQARGSRPSTGAMLVLRGDLVQPLGLDEAIKRLRPEPR